MSSLPRHSRQKTIQRGLPKSRCGESARRYIRRGGSVSGMWRRLRGEFPDMTISRVPRAWLPEMKSRRQKGFRHFPHACWSGDMVFTFFVQFNWDYNPIPPVFFFWAWRGGMWSRFLLCRAPRVSNNMFDNYVFAQCGFDSKDHWRLRGLHQARRRFTA